MLRATMLAAALMLIPATALAHSCPRLMGEIDATLPAAQLSEADRARVAELRAEGERLHGAGDHDGSMAALEAAKQLLGI